VAGRRQVEDRQPPMGEPERTVLVDALVVRTAMGKDTGHRLQDTRVRGSAVRAKETRYPTHDGAFWDPV
jgi:hypothetical protein